MSTEHVRQAETKNEVEAPSLNSSDAELAQLESELLFQSSLPARDFNQELDKTCGLGHALELAIGSLVKNGLITDTDDADVRGVVALVEVLADRLDDLKLMHRDNEEWMHVRDLRQAKRMHQATHS